jgi:diphosphomevalonate decarboxylase
MSTTACAHPNIALIKYWGKSPRPGNYPAAPSLSITLDTLVTTTEVHTCEQADRIFLDSVEVADPKVLACLSELRAEFQIPHLEVHTSNNFPTAAGLASSASGFAALVTAINAHCELGLDQQTQSDRARRASGSAARSVLGGFVALQGPQWVAEQVLETDAWPLRTVIAITTSQKKNVSSSDGMKLSEETSPYYASWLTSTTTDFTDALRFVQSRDFDALASLAEFSCLKMHGLMLSTNPGLLYWNPATIACLHAIRELRQQGLPVFFTVDAGPQVKAVCLPQAEDQVQHVLQGISGVEQVLTTGLGGGAWIAGS